MLIVSQNKDTIVNFDNVDSIDIVADLDETGEVPSKIYYETSTKREELGEYATEERAREVLEEIIEVYLGVRAIENIGVEVKLTFEQSNAVRSRPKCYFMPKE